MVGAAHAQAQLTSSGPTYRCVDSAGRSTYTNVKEEMGSKKCTVVSREVSVVPSQASSAGSAPATRTGAAPTESGRPVARTGSQSSTTQRARETDRQRILEQELNSADQQLAEARRKLVEQEGIRNGNERNYTRVLERLKPFQDEVRHAEDNVSALKRELSNLR